MLTQVKALITAPEIKVKLNLSLCIYLVKLTIIRGVLYLVEAVG